MTVDKFIYIWQTLWKYLYKFFAQLTGDKYGSADGSYEYPVED